MNSAANKATAHDLGRAIRLAAARPVAASIQAACCLRFSALPQIDFSWHSD